MAEEDQLRDLAKDWRALLFADANDDTFADGFAQTVTFALLLARVEKIDFATGGADASAQLQVVARDLEQRHRVIGTALGLLTYPQLLARLGVSVDVLLRVLGAVDWAALTGEEPDAWLLFYERFLSQYDPALRRRTGSYYTQQPLVDAIVRLVDDLVECRFHPTGRGLATEGVTILDPAMGTGTFLLSVLRTVAERAAADGPGKVPAAVADAARRIHGFELQVGPYAVAEMRLAAELVDRVGGLPPEGLRVYVTNTLDDHRKDPPHFGHAYAPLTESQRAANEVKGPTPLLVVLGNPPYKERSRGEGAWVESRGNEESGLLFDWVNTDDPSVERHLKHLYNPYIYFWRWAAWKVFERDRAEVDPQDRGIVAFVSVAGFLSGPGFKPMRRWLRRMCDDIYVIDLTPEGHQPPVASRPFREVQQPVCICIAVRTADVDESIPANVWHRAVTPGRIEDKYAELAQVRIGGDGWQAGAVSWGDPFLPAPSQAWGSFPRLNEVTCWDGSGVMPGRTWVYAPEPDALEERWRSLLTQSDFVRKQRLFKPHTVRGKLSDRHLAKELKDDIPGYAPAGRAILDESVDAASRRPVRVAYRSFDRQYLIPDKRLINRPNASLWRVRDAPGQVFLTALMGHSPASGPAATFCSLIPDHDHYQGNHNGRVFPLWLDPAATKSNVPPGLLNTLTTRYGYDVPAEDVFAYLAAMLANPHYTARFTEDLASPGLRIPLTADPDLFADAGRIGRRIIWLHTFGERYTDPADGRSPGAPRAPMEQRPQLITPISPPGGPLPDTFDYDAGAQTLTIGEGTIAPMREEVVDYTVGRMNVLRSWLDYRWANRDTRATRNPESASPLDQITHKTWIGLFDNDLLDILNVLTLLVELEPSQAVLLDAVCEGPLLAYGDLKASDALLAAEERASYQPKVIRPRRKPVEGEQQLPND
jgi:hypothetical protein